MITPIYDWYDLDSIRNDLGGDYALMRNIGPSTPGYDEFNSGSGWLPIGTDRDNRFRGSFDGRGRTISGLRINRPDANNVGLFGHVGDDGLPTVIRNLHILDVDVIGGRGTGALIGRVTGNAGTLIERCSAVGGSVEGDAAVGGLIGSHNSHRDTPGGDDNPVLRLSYADIDVFFSGKGADTQKFGGLAGCSQKGTISDCYARGSVTAEGVDRVGGLAGCIVYRGIIRNSYSTGSISAAGSTNVGGLLGMRIGPGANRGEAYDSFWDVQTSGMASSAGGTGKTTAEMKNADTYIDTSTEGLSSPWDFVLIWSIDASVNSGYPIFEFSDLLPIFTLSVQADPAAGGEVFGGGQYESGDTVTITAIPAHGWVFAGWSAGAEQSKKETTFIMPAEDSVVIASFYYDEEEPAPAFYNLYLYAEPPYGGGVSGAGEYAEGAEVNIGATAEAGWEFSAWSAAAADPLEEETTFSMPAKDSVLYAYFIQIIEPEPKPDSFNLSVYTEPVMGGLAYDDTGGSPYKPGDYIEISAFANPGWRFTGWAVYYGGEFGDADMAQTGYIMPENDVVLYANFEEYSPDPDSGPDDDEGESRRPAPQPGPSPERPAPPSGFRVDPLYGIILSNHITWNESESRGISAYKLYVSTGEGRGVMVAEGGVEDFKFSLLAEFSPETFEYMHRGLSGIRYYYVITSVNEEGFESEMTSPVYWANPGTGEYGFMDPIPWPGRIIEPDDEDGSGCFIATAVYGYCESSEVAPLREFRDVVLLASGAGSMLVKAYYAGSPALAESIDESRFLRRVARVHLAPFVRFAGIFLSLN